MGGGFMGSEKGGVDGYRFLFIHTHAHEREKERRLRGKEEDIFFGDLP